MGFFNGAPVFRIDSPEAEARVFPPSKWKRMFPERPFRPGLQMVVAGFSLHLDPMTAAEAQAAGIDIEAACSTPRLARAIVALGTDRRAA
jgi:hypothetical protein